MGSVGEELKAAREAKRLSVRELADKTRISSAFLEALEGGNYAMLPGDVFVRGFLRNYARELGLDEEAVLARYREETGAKAEQERPPEAPAQAPPPESAGKRSRSPISTVLLVMMFGVLVVTGVYYIISHFGEEQAEEQPGQEQPAGEVPYMPVQQVITTVVEPQAPEARTSPLKLRLTAVEYTWYSFIADEKEPVSGFLRKGDTLDIEAENSILLDLGNAGGVRAEQDGEELPPFGKSGYVLKEILFQKGTKGVARPGRVPSPGDDSPPERPEAKRPAASGPLPGGAH